MADHSPKPLVLNADRKDRSIRLWGGKTCPYDSREAYSGVLTHLHAERGQLLLEQGHVCVLNATVVGTEVLKNLVLPGVGKFTIVDNKPVTEQDLGNNFFIDEESIGEPRGQVVTRLLVEMNDEVAGKYVKEDPAALINDNIGFFSSIGVTCIVATDLSEASLRKLGAHCWEHKIPLFVGRAYGMVGLWRNVLAEHCVVESRPEYSKENFRLTDPFPELQAFVDRFDLATCTHPYVPLTETSPSPGVWKDSQGKECAPKAHSHVPAFVILIKALALWRAKHSALPKTADQKEAFKVMLDEMKATPLVEEDNFAEARAMARHAYAPFEVPSEVRSLFGDDKAHDGSTCAVPFWVIVRALRRFVDGEGRGHLPLSGALPDMHADTKSYVELHNIYRAKAARECAAVAAHVQSILAGLGLPPEAVPGDEVAHVCKHACEIRMVRTRSLEDEYTQPNTDEWAWMLEVEGREYPHALYVLLRAADRFRTLLGRWPGEADCGPSETARFKEVLGSVCGEIGLQPSKVDEELVLEMVRYGGSELHSVAAVVGGIGAQEVTKVLMRQFVPAAGAFVFNGITGKSSLCQV